MKIKNIVQKKFIEILNENDITFDDLNDSTILLDTGLDSLSFAVLVARLEEEIGYDPFFLLKEPFYPKTYGDLIGIYEKYKNHASKTL